MKNKMKVTYDTVNLKDHHNGPIQSQMVITFQIHFSFAPSKYECPA